MLLKKIFGGLIAFSVICSSMNLSVFANDNDGILAKAYSSMSKAKFNSNSYGWEKEMYAEIPDFTDGVLSGKIKDFDNDGVSELLTLKIANSNTNDGDKYAAAYMEMYEVINSKAELVSTTESFPVIDHITDAGGLECFIKDKYIVLECAIQNNTFADGANQCINIYSYNGKEFKNELQIVFSGSSMSFDGDNSIPDKLKELGFLKSAENLSTEYFSPYFIFSTDNSVGYTFDSCINFAKIEDNINPIFEMLIINNNQKLSYNYEDIDNWNDYFVNNGVMTIINNNFSSVEVPISIIINDNKISFNEPPYIENGTTMVPMRAVFEALGATVDYNASTKYVTAKKDNNTISFISGAKNAYVNGDLKTLNVPITNKNGNTMIPLRFVSEALGADVEWNSDTRTVTIKLRENVDSTSIPISDNTDNSIEDKVNVIRELFKQTNEETDYTITNFAGMDLGGAVYKSNKDGKIKKIIVDEALTGLDIFKTELYIKDNRVYFVYVIYNNREKNTTEEFRYYLDNDKLIRYIGPDKVVQDRLDTQEYAEIENDVFTSFIEYYWKIAFNTDYR